MSKNRGSTEVFLEVRESNLSARKLYNKLNFVEIGVRNDYYPAVGELPAEDAIALVLPIR